MIPLGVMVVVILIARGLGAAGWHVADTWKEATRIGLAAMFAFTAAAHFNRMRPDMIRMVPPRFPNPGLLVTLTGLAELAGAIGLLVPALARWAAAGLILLLVAVFPANVHAARAGVRVGNRPATRLALRVPMQLLWIVLLWWSVTP